MGGLDYGELEEGELDAPAASTPVTPAETEDRRATTKPIATFRCLKGAS